MVSQLFQNNSYCVKPIRATITHHNLLFKMAVPGKFQVKISDSQINFFLYKHFLAESCPTNLITNIIFLGVKIIH